MTRVGPATFVLAMAFAVLVIMAVCRIEPAQASAPCWFEKHPTRPVWRIA